MPPSFLMRRRTTLSVKDTSIIYVGLMESRNSNAELQNKRCFPSIYDDLSTVRKMKASIIHMPLDASEVSLSHVEKAKSVESSYSIMSMRLMSTDTEYTTIYRKRIETKRHSLGLAPHNVATSCPSSSLAVWACGLHKGQPRVVEFIRQDECQTERTK